MAQRRSGRGKKRVRRGPEREFADVQDGWCRGSARALRAKANKGGGAHVRNVIVVK
jgi:hypothetical protein